MLIQTFIINLKQRIDRKTHSKRQFKNKKIFFPKIVTAIENPVGALGLWESICLIVADAKRRELEWILICEDDHMFTKSYRERKILDSIDFAKKNDVELILGGVSWFSNSFIINDKYCWIDGFSGLQFCLISKTMYSRILNFHFTKFHAADLVLSELSEKKVCFYPFISIQKDFGYSDASENQGPVEDLYNTSMRRLDLINFISQSIDLKACTVNKSAYDQMHLKCPVRAYTIVKDFSQATLDHVNKQFASRPEFSNRVINVKNNSDVKYTLLRAIRKVVEEAYSEGLDLVAICTEEHEFAESYSVDYLFESIQLASEVNSHILFMNLENISLSIPISSCKLFWTDKFPRSTFFIIFREIFPQILSKNINAEMRSQEILTNLTSNKFFIFPFMSNKRNLQPHIDDREKEQVISRATAVERTLQRIKENQYHFLYQNNKTK